MEVDQLIKLDMCKQPTYNTCTSTAFAFLIALSKETSHRDLTSWLISICRGKGLLTDNHGISSEEIIKVIRELGIQATILTEQPSLPFIIGA